jgi:hypothetical protein
VEKVDWRDVRLELFPDTGVHMLFEHWGHHPVLFLAVNCAGICLHEDLARESFHLCILFRNCVAEICVFHFYKFSNKGWKNQILHQSLIFRDPQVLQIRHRLRKRSKLSESIVKIRIEFLIWISLPISELRIPGLKRQIFLILPFIHRWPVFAAVDH